MRTRIGFVNGCFDCFHEGHEYFLKYAIANCDYLIAAVNSDASVKRLKGEGRPIKTWFERAMSVRSVASSVIPFEGREEPLLMAIRPDVIIKGYDHSPAETVQMVRNIGWKDGAGAHLMRVLHAPLLMGYSTTKILEDSRQ